MAVTTNNNKVTFGLANVVYSTITRSEGSLSFALPKKLQYATEMSATIIGGKNDIYADDQVIATLSAYSGQDLTLTFTELSDDFKKDCLGYKESTDGSLVEITNAKPVEFALGLQISGDSKARRIWYFSCTATPYAESSTTKKDSVEVNYPQIAITAKPVDVGDNKVLREIIYEGATGYDDALTTAPALPAFGV